MRTINIKSKSSLKTAISVLKRGGVIIFPTDTVYGIGCILNPNSIKKLYQIKNRPLTQPTAVLISEALYHSEDLYHKIRSSAKCGIADKILKQSPKGKITVVMGTKYFKIKFPKILLKDNKIGFRIPDDKWLEKLIDKVGPIVASSANKAGERPPKKFSEIDKQIIKEADLTVKTKEILSGKPSAVYDLEKGIFVRP